MEKRISTLVAALLILMGVLGLASNFLAPVLGWDMWRWGAWRLWPLVVISIGLLFVLSPLMVRDKPALGALFIPGVPILTTGGILLFASVFDIWEAWEWLWPLEVLAVAVGFLLAGITMRVIWLLIPAFVVGANGLLFLFCALTDMWESWAILWTIEPLSVGLSFLVISARRRSAGLFLAGLIVSGLAAIGMIGMTAIFPWWWMTNLAGPLILIVVGGLLLARSLVRPASGSEPPANGGTGEVAEAAAA